MGRINAAIRVKLFCGIISSGAEVSEETLKILQGRFGNIDYKSAEAPFTDFSDYYNPEMGETLSRFWVSFDRLVYADELADIKVWTNSVEDDFAISGKRRINIDPGYITPASVILASTKNFSHRIYLSKGIYGEVTTIYEKNKFVKLPWSYQDYFSKPAQDFLIEARTKLLKQLKETK